MAIKFNLILKKIIVEEIFTKIRKFLPIFHNTCVLCTHANKQQDRFDQYKDVINDYIQFKMIRLNLDIL